MTRGTTKLEANAGTCDFAVAFHKSERGFDQDEWFELSWEGRRLRHSLHDQEAIYAVPGLYEHLVFEDLGCHVPEFISKMVSTSLQGQPGILEVSRVLELNAGNGVVGEELRSLGIQGLMGVDPLLAAARAARRDRPDLYDDYLVADISRPDPHAEGRLQHFDPNALVCSSPLSFWKVPSEAFLRAFHLLPVGGWLAMCIPDETYGEEDDYECGELVGRLITDQNIEILDKHRYVHRTTTAGKELYAVLLVARKCSQSGLL